MQFPPSRAPLPNRNDDDLDAGPAAAGQRSDRAAATAPAPEAGASSDAVILDPEKLPVWQRAFILGPNVRFGRTPGPAVLKGEAADTLRAPAADAPARAGAAPAGYVLGRGNPTFTPPAKVEGSPVGDLQRQIAQALSQGSATEASADKASSPSFVLPPRTGAPLRVPPRPIREALRAEAAQAAAQTRTPPVKAPHAVATTPAAPACSPMPAPSPSPALRMSASTLAETSAASVQRAPQIMTAPAQPVTVPAQPPVQTVVQTQVSAPARATASPARPVTAIPDHLLWEMMSLGASESADALPVSRPASPRPSEIMSRRPADPRPAAVVSGPFMPPAPRTTPVAPVMATVVRMPPPTAAGDPPIDHQRPARFVPRVKALVPQAPAAPLAEAPSAVHLYRSVELRQALVTAAAEPLPAAQPPVMEPLAEQPVEARPGTPTEASTEVSFVRSSARRTPGPLSYVQTDDYLFPSVELLQAAGPRLAGMMSQEALEQSAGLLESILEDFGVKGEIIDVRPGPVVTLYEFEPAPGVKSSRVINLSDDIARSMSALSARVAVVPGRNVIGIELPNVERETVFLRELIESSSYVGTDFRLPLCLGKTIGGEPVIAELAKMPHLLVAGTTGSGKSVAINTMILSLIYNLRPEECRLIMVDPKMLELSVYDGIPHLLTPVVTDPKKAVLALKWAVREMEERYRKMSRLGVRNIDGFNARVAEARAKGETIMLPTPVGFDKSTGEQIFEDQELDLTALPYIVVIVDEMADLMMVAGKEIEGAIQRLAQMARAAGIHLIMATQRPSVDVITGTIKANFPTRISFQVTSKIDSRTILGEQGAEHLLGQGDMLHMIGGGRISRVHGPFVSDHEVEKVVAHLKTQGQPAYLGSVTEDSEEGVCEEDEDSAVFDNTAMGAEGDSDELYERAVKVVLRDKKCSTSYIQRRLSIGYNRAASLVERMEQEGLVGAPNHVGKREILSQRPTVAKDAEDQTA
ncbi:MAG: DNA translocase FtsK [Allorhizobium sp.]